MSIQYRKTFLSFLLSFFIVACNSSDRDRIGDAIDNPSDISDIIEGIDRKPIDTTRMGVNAFGNKPAFGSPCAQFAEVRDTLKLKYIRILFQWNNAVHPSPDSPISYGFYDDLARCIPAGTDALVVLTGLPTWMGDRNNWIDGNPRTTFVERWVRPLINRYASNRRIIGFQIWNEPDFDTDADNSILEMVDNPENYVEMLARAHSISKDIAPGKLVVNATTTGLVQRFPATLNYNIAMRDAGIQNFTDVYAIHYYGMQFEKFIAGARGFLQSLSRPIWITESGIKGMTQQLAYVETVWPYLREQVPGIDRIYYYQFGSETAPEDSFGLRNTSPTSPVSDLYIFLRDR